MEWRRTWWELSCLFTWIFRLVRWIQGPSAPEHPASALVPGEKHKAVHIKPAATRRTYRILIPSQVMCYLNTPYSWVDVQLQHLVTLLSGFVKSQTHYDLTSLPLRREYLNISEGCSQDKVGSHCDTLRIVLGWGLPVVAHSRYLISSHCQATHSFTVSQNGALIYSSSLSGVILLSLLWHLPPLWILSAAFSGPPKFLACGGCTLLLSWCGRWTHAGLYYCIFCQVSLRHSQTSPSCTQFHDLPLVQWSCQHHLNQNTYHPCLCPSPKYWLSQNAVMHCVPQYTVSPNKII